MLKDRPRRRSTRSRNTGSAVGLRPPWVTVIKDLEPLEMLDMDMPRPGGVSFNPPAVRWKNLEREWDYPSPRATASMLVFGSTMALPKDCDLGLMASVERDMSERMRIIETWLMEQLALVGLGVDDREAIKRRCVLKEQQITRTIEQWVDVMALEVDGVEVGERLHLTTDFDFGNLESM